MATSSTHKGWKFDAANNRLQAMYNGTEVFDFDANDLAVAMNTVFSGTVQTGAATLASGSVTGNLTLGLTLTAGADGVGADGEQLTSGGAAAECDWSAAGSLREFKKILGMRTDEDEALRAIVETPVYDFQYKSKAESGERITSTGDTKTVYTGIMADEAPWAMHHNGRILNPINSLGYTMLAIKALYKELAETKAELAALKA